METHLKTKKLNKIADSIFGSWEWISNMHHCDKGCRIMLGWNSQNIRLNVVHCDKQSLLCCVETIDSKIRLFCTIVYVPNGGNERKELWRDLELYKKIIGKEAWILLGDLNVTLFPNEHSH